MFPADILLLSGLLGVQQLVFGTTRLPGNTAVVQCLVVRALLPLMCRTQLQQELHNAVLQPIFRWYQSVIDDGNDSGRVAVSLINTYISSSSSRAKPTTEVVVDKGLLDTAAAVAEQLILYAAGGQHAAAEVLQQQQRQSQKREQQLQADIQQLQDDLQVCFLQHHCITPRTSSREAVMLLCQ